MANVNVTYQDMQTAATKLTQGEHEINNQLDGLRREVEGLVQSGYVTDSSSKQFEQSYLEFTDGVKRVVEGLQGMANYLTKAASTFEEADRALAGALAH